MMGGHSDSRGPAGRAPRLTRIAAVALAAWLGAAAASAADDEKEREKKRPPDQSTVEGTVEGNVAGELSFLASPPFPELAITEAVRIELRTFYAPDGSIGSGHVSVVRPEVATRATWFASERVVSRIAIQAADSQYDFRGAVWGPIVHPLTGQNIDADELIGDLDLHAARVAADAGYLLTDRVNWFAEGERWSLLGSAYGGSRWENGDFDSGLAAGGALGFGYEIPKRLRLALGVSMRTPIDDAKLDIDPLVSLRWRPNDWVTLRTRELGLQIEVAVTPLFAVYLTGFRSSDGYRLKDRPPLGDLSFREHHIRLGGGFEWTLANWLHLEFETGALTDRNLRVHEKHLGTLLSRRPHTSAFLEVRLEFRL